MKRIDELSLPELALELRNTDLRTEEAPSQRLRHSFITYRLAKTNDENLTAVEAGNSPSMIHQSYRQIKDHTGRVITPELANAWFGIEPGGKPTSCR